MKTRVLTFSVFAFCVIALASVASLTAQSFVVEMVDPATMYVTPSSYPLHHGLLINTSSMSKTVQVRYFANQKNLSHAASMCTGEFCYDLPESFLGEPYDLPTFELAGGDSIELKAILLPGGYEGISTLRFNIFDAANPTDSISYAMTFNVSLANSVQDLNEVAAVEVGPNPASDHVAISSSMLSQVSGVDVYSADGRILRSQNHDGSQRIVVDVSTLPAGSYHVILTLTSGAVYRTPISVVR